MRKVNSKATKVLERIRKLACAASGHVKIDNAPGAFMPLCVERLSSLPKGELWSLAHYGEQNGDLMADPDIVFLRVDASTWFPVEFTNHYVGMYQELVKLDTDGSPKTFWQTPQRDAAIFVGTWMENVRHQQEV